MSLPREGASMINPNLSVKKQTLTRKRRICVLRDPLKLPRVTDRNGRTLSAYSYFKTMYIPSEDCLEFSGNFRTFSSPSQKSLFPLAVTCCFPFCPGPVDHSYIFYRSLWIFLFWTFHINGFMCGLP